MTKSSRMGWVIVALATLGLVAPATGADRELINVYCVGAGVDGFLSPDVGDSTKDVTKFLGGKKKTLRLVESEADADLTVTITGREVQGTGKKEYTTRSSEDRCLATRMRASMSCSRGAVIRRQSSFVAKDMSALPMAR